MQLQTREKTFRAVCFSPEKHLKCKAVAESSSPVKIYNYQLKRNSRTQQEEIHMGKRSKLLDPDTEEVMFDFVAHNSEEASQSHKPGLSSIEAVLEVEIGQHVNVYGRLTFQGPQQTIRKNEKTLLLQEAVITDETASIRVVLWENDPSRVKSGMTCKLYNVMVREYEGKNTSL